MEEARIDKWLWAARIFKTRSIAVDAIKNSRVTINGMNVKPSRMVKVGEVVSVRKPPVTYSFKILKTIEQRVGAKLIPEIYENVTPADQYELLEMNRISGFVDRARGTGRPTKKERRALDEFIGPSLEGFDDFDFDVVLARGGPKFLHFCDREALVFCKNGHFGVAEQLV